MNYCLAQQLKETARLRKPLAAALVLGCAFLTVTKTTFIQQLNTKGGSAPADGCSIDADVGNQTLVPCTADYYFFRKNE